MSYAKLRAQIEESTSAESIVDLEVKMSRIYKAGSISFSHYMRLENLCVARKLEFICLKPAKVAGGDNSDLQAAFDGVTA